MPTADVAEGYGVNEATLRTHKRDHADELVDGKHWVVGITNTLGGPQQATLWTKRGVVRLGFFIRSERAKRFRDAAEDLVIAAEGAVRQPPRNYIGALEECLRLARENKALEQRVVPFSLHLWGRQSTCSAPRTGPCDARVWPPEYGGATGATPWRSNRNGAGRRGSRRSCPSPAQAVPTTCCE